ncbi:MULTISPECIES: Flp family type IVb pilin [unclassified Dietzia]|uniref:Flp family type IVb pilin n=1 Tax=unclassified Dietzia TaxID=2617939 RepID=UPI000D201F2E|nr:MULTISPECIES: Flp family type IVb pilin [unclassified Dietzia]AVZ40526.1 Flp family type IVb pilin [Dietzia sp. JS16-p6b]QGW26060.1 Pilus subunit protein PilA [Dietzia sp. DQ12-45-1b]
MSQVAAYYFTLYALVSDRFEDRKDRGATAVEYGLMVGLIAVVIIVAVVALGDTLDGLFRGVVGDLGGTVPE